jgi:excisionase family DNA binding protein
MEMGKHREAYWTANEVAAFVRLSLSTIRRLTMNKEIPFHKINRSVRYEPDEIKEWVEKRKMAAGKQGTPQMELTENETAAEAEAKE